MRLAVICYLVPCIYAYAINRGGLPGDRAESDHSPPPGHTPSNFLHEQVPLRVPSSLGSLEPLDPYPDKPRISFNKDGSFKLTIFSDVHFGENPWDWWGPGQDIKTNALMETLLNIEMPDYVVINGDLITGENTFRENSTSLIDSIVLPLNAAKVPFSSTSGNHDSHINITRADEIARETAIAPWSYTRSSPPGVGGAGGPGNYWVPVYQEVTDHTPALILWFFDSRGMRGVYRDGSHMPDWVDSSVAEWIRSETEKMNTIWGPPEQRSALAFVHIPPHVIEAVQENLNSSMNPGLNADTLGQGSTQASSDPASLGRDNEFWHSLNTNVKNLRAVISGHGKVQYFFSSAFTNPILRCFPRVMILSVLLVVSDSIKQYETMAQHLKCCITFMVQVFYTQRVWIISGQNIIITFVVLACAILHLVFGLIDAVVIVEVIRTPTNAVLYSTNYTPLSAVSSAACDAIITLSVVYYLRPASIRRESFIKILLVVSVQMGSFTFINSLAMVILFYMQYHTLGQFLMSAPGMILSKSYVNSMLGV
ncbi:Metallo-dependent phosphatase-like protein [Lanmaoa asiatica]|nr:Metallo-dependent phosphatase-like protein [Lanmaoa asiatica]